jgi:hypothetical protein
LCVRPEPHTDIYIYIYTYIYIYMHTHTLTSEPSTLTIQSYVSTLTTKHSTLNHSPLHTQTHTHTHTQTNTHKHTHTHSYTYACTYAYTYTRAWCAHMQSERDARCTRACAWRVGMGHMHVHADGHGGYVLVECVRADCLLVSCPGSSACTATRSACCRRASLTSSRRFSE